MKKSWISAALAVGLTGGTWAVGQDTFREDGPRVRPPVHEHDENRPGRPGPQRPIQVDPHAHELEHGDPRRQTASRVSVIRQRTDAVANELDYIQEHLEEHIEEGHADQTMVRLYRQADAALAEAVHFRRSLKPDTSPQEIGEHFRVLDGQVHGLMQAMQTTDDRALRRSAARLAFADEQLNAAVATSEGRPAGDFIARQAHVLAGEAQRLERAARAAIAHQDHHAGGDHRGDRELLDSLLDFTAKVEHFHDTAENENDPAHLAVDFEIVDQSWHRVVDLMNRNVHGAYLARRAERVGSMHDELSRVIGVKAPRHTIRFNIGGIGVNLQR